MLTCVYQPTAQPLAKNCLVKLERDSKKVLVSRFSAEKGGQVKVELVKNKNLNSFIHSQPNHPFSKKSPGRAKRTWGNDTNNNSNNNNSNVSGSTTSSGCSSHKSTSLWSSFDSDDASGSSGSTCDNSNSEWESAYSSDSEPVSFICVSTTLCLESVERKSEKKRRKIERAFFCTVPLRDCLPSWSFFLFATKCELGKKNVVFASSVQCSKEIVRENENLSRYFILYFTAILYNQLCSGITYAYKSTKDLSMTSWVTTMHAVRGTCISHKKQVALL